MKAEHQSTYIEDAKKGIASNTLQQNLKNIQDRFGKGVLKFWEELEDPEIRDRVKEARMNNFEHLDIILLELAENIRKRGGHVFFATTAEEAVDYTREIARQHKVKSVVKGKSMTSLEIDIDAPLQEDGVEIIETDLGEYIVQLANELPSHIIAPCVHMNRQEIGELFASKLEMDYTDDPPTLTMAARKSLREKMIHADMGLTGCNLACAETGQISLVSNEGNIRMATTIPPVHVALMGMERIVATMEEHREALQLLTRGAALQKLSTYVSFMGGPSKESDPDGPKEFHLVILDNGRSKILHDPEFREVLACIRCGACLNICPVYGKIGGHAYNSAYCGPIGAVVTPLLKGINKHADLCKGETLCGACLDICPVKNDLPRMLAALRHKLAYGDDYWNVEQHSPKEAKAYRYWKRLVTNGPLYRTAIKAGRFLQKRFVGKDGLIHSLPGLGSNWTKDRDLPPIARLTFQEIWKKKYQSSSSLQPKQPETVQQNLNNQEAKQ